MKKKRRQKTAKKATLAIFTIFFLPPAAPPSRDVAKKSLCAQLRLRWAEGKKYKNESSEKAKYNAHEEDKVADIFSLFITHWSLLFFFVCSFSLPCLHCIMHNKNNFVQRHAMQQNFCDRWKIITFSSIQLWTARTVCRSLSSVTCHADHAALSDFNIDFMRRQLSALFLLLHRRAKKIAPCCAILNCQSE